MYVWDSGGLAERTLNFELFQPPSLHSAPLFADSAVSSLSLKPSSTAFLRHYQLQSSGIQIMTDGHPDVD